ncbi:MAG: permease [Endomicrobiia bacterium]
MKILLILTIISLLLSFYYNKEKTLLGIKKGLMMLLTLLPTVLNVLIFVSIFLVLVPQDLLIKLLGKNSGVLGIIIASILGSISLMPGIISFPLGKILLDNGASYTVVTTFLTTLMMVGVITLPMEIKYFGVKVSLLRNVLNFFGAIIIALIIGVLM